MWPVRFPGKLAYAGFSLHSDRLNELAQRLILFGICRPQGDVFRFSVPLPREAIAPLDVRPASTSSAAGRLLLARADLRSCRASSSVLRKDSAPLRIAQISPKESLNSPCEGHAVKACS